MEKNLELLVPSYNAWGVAEISEEDTEFARSTKSHSHTKMMVMQAVAYTLVAFVANAANLSHLREKDMGEEPNLELSTMRMILQIVHAVVRPSQGLLNFVVFLGQKAYDRCRIDNTLIWKEAMRTVLFDREYPHHAMSDLTEMIIGASRFRRKKIEEKIIPSMRMNTRIPTMMLMPTKRDNRV